MDYDTFKKDLESRVPGKVMTTKEAIDKYKFISFLAPYCTVIDKQTGEHGTLQFTHQPRFYFNFVKK